MVRWLMLWFLWIPHAKIYWPELCKLRTVQTLQAGWSALVCLGLQAMLFLPAAPTPVMFCKHKYSLSLHVYTFIKKSGSRSSSSSYPHACNSLYMPWRLRTLVKAPDCFLSEEMRQLSILGPVLQSPGSLYWSGSDCRPWCVAQHMQNSQIIKPTIDKAI